MHRAYWPHFTEQRLYNAAIKEKSIRNPPQTAIFPAPANGAGRVRQLFPLLFS